MRCLVLGPTLPWARMGSDAIERHTCTFSCDMSRAQTKKQKEKDVIDSSEYMTQLQLLRAYYGLNNCKQIQDSVQACANHVIH